MNVVWIEILSSTLSQLGSIYIKLHVFTLKKERQKVCISMRKYSNTIMFANVTRTA